MYVFVFSSLVILVMSFFLLKPLLWLPMMLTTVSMTTFNASLSYYFLGCQFLSRNIKLRVIQSLIKRTFCEDEERMMSFNKLHVKSVITCFSSPLPSKGKSNWSLIFELGIFCFLLWFSFYIIFIHLAFSFTCFKNDRGKTCVASFGLALQDIWIWLTF